MKNSIYFLSALAMLSHSSLSYWEPNSILPNADTILVSQSNITITESFTLGEGQLLLLNGTDGVSINENVKVQLEDRAEIQISTDIDGNGVGSLQLKKGQFQLRGNSQVKIFQPLSQIHSINDSIEVGVINYLQINNEVDLILMSEIIY